jgi:hypothetical protein
VRAFPARRAKENVAILFLARRRIEVQPRHGVVIRSQAIRPFIENHLLLARN